MYHRFGVILIAVLGGGVLQATAVAEEGVTSVPQAAIPAVGVPDPGSVPSTGPLSGLPGAATEDGEYFDCLLEPRMVVNVSSTSAGIIEEMPVDRGDRVKKGDVLVRLRSDEEQRAVELARAKADIASKKQKRGEELFAEHFVSQHEKDGLDTDKLVAQIEYRQAVELLKRRTIRSSINGVVVERFLSPGELAEGEKIMKVAQIDPLNVEVVVPVEKLGTLRKGGQALVYPEMSTSVALPATITVLDSVVDAASGTMGVRLELPNPDHAVPAGLKCRIRFTRDETEAGSGK